MRSPQRTRPVPGPLLPIAFVLLLLTGTLLRAHDPGLSALDVRVSGATISVSLSIAAADLRLLVPDGGADIRLKLTELARDAVRLSVDGEALPAAVDEVAMDDGAARVRLSVAIGHSRGQPRRLTIASDVPRRVAPGHRQLMTVTLGDRVLSETLLDAQSGPAAIDLEAAVPSAARVARRYVELGVRHILSGYDHLVFLAGLLLAARTGRELLFALTAFTVAHSVTLGLVAIAGVQAPASIVEPLIAASIAWIGLENLLQRRHGARWRVVFGFGLIHGLGFAGALTELGLGSSPGEIALALLSFNAGVEAGQLAVAAAKLPVVWTMRARPLWQARLVPVCSLMIVLAGGYWLIERLP